MLGWLCLPMQQLEVLESNSVALNGQLSVLVFTWQPRSIQINSIYMLHLDDMNREYLPAVIRAKKVLQLVSSRG